MHAVQKRCVPFNLLDAHFNIYRLLSFSKSARMVCGIQPLNCSASNSGRKRRPEMRNTSLRMFTWLLMLNTLQQLLRRSAVSRLNWQGGPTSCSAIEKWTSSTLLSLLYGEELPTPTENHDGSAAIVRVFYDHHLLNQNCAILRQSATIRKTQYYFMMQVTSFFRNTLYIFSWWRHLVLPEPGALYI